MRGPVSMKSGTGSLLSGATGSGMLAARHRKAKWHGVLKSKLVVRHLPERKGICDAVSPAFDYLEARLSGPPLCEAQYECTTAARCTRSSSMCMTS